MNIYDDTVQAAFVYVLLLFLCLLNISYDLCSSLVIYVHLKIRFVFPTSLVFLDDLTTNRTR